MNELQPLNASGKKFSDDQIKLMMKTMCKDANNDEMMVFLQMCANYGLDPFRKEAYLQIFNKGNPEKRNMAIVLSIGAYRTMAQRSGDYRPDPEEPEYIYDESLKSDTNPLGIEKAVATVYKQDNKGDWYAIKGAAYWDEFAKVDKCGLESTWKKMPRLMIAKCAETQALRKGWPETFSGTFSDGEMQGYDVVEQYETEKEIKRIELVGGKDTFTMMMEDGKPLENIPSGKMHDRCMEKVRQFETVAELESWENVNSVALRQFWAYDKKACHDFKANLDAQRETLRKMEEANAEENQT